ncbi:MAG: hypothetical protein JJE22_15565, partial [Bacteroidia bacterium]|nr:hypothetical protein [Bacteroidia bacterium]
LDLQKAEAQAREAQIEAALERVRSRSMAMHKSEELIEVVWLMDSEIAGLGITLDNTSINTDFSFEEDGFNVWIAARGKSYLEKFHIPYSNRHDRVSENLYEAIEEGLDYYTDKYSKAEKNKYFKWLFKHSDFRKLPEERKQFVLNTPGWTRATVVSKNSFLTFQQFKLKEFTEEESGIFKRFGKVFDQTYTRFLDLQKAEAQAREAEIELALERVRARTMAMQSSDELREAVLVINEQLQHLGFESNATNIIIIDKETGNSQYWVSGFTKDIFPVSYQVPKLNHPYYDALLDPWRRGDQYVVYEYTGAGKKSFDKIFFTETDFKNVPAEAKNAMISLPSVTLSTAFFSYGALQVLGPEAISEDKVIILQRFAKVFNQTYTRFIDLQKAEEQARESQIELGLERVRARAMAMQTSNELSDLVDTVFKELTKLDFEISMCIINIIDESTLSNMVWGANPETGKPPESYYMKFEDYPFHHAMMKGYKERAAKYIYVIEGDEKKNYDEYLFNETEFRKMPPEAQSASRAMKRYVASFSFSNFGGLQTVGGEPLSEANLDIFARFGKVFDLTYTRFNDLLKAEAQAREAQIEAALERVRSRSMGMQKSEELKEVIKIVYQQLRHLNINLDHAGFVVDYTPGGDWHFWIADEQDIPSKITHPWFDSVWANQFDEAKEKGKNFFATHLNFEEKNKFYQDLFRYVPGLSEQSKEFYFNCPGLAASNVLLENVALYIENFSAIPYTDEENKTLMRFGKVFQQTYTRFLDLQKAEEQARESEIELALERVRARTMAMQHSDELADASFLLDSQIRALGIKTRGCAFNIYGENESTEWFSSEMGTMPMYKTPRENVFLRYYEEGQKGKQMYIESFTGDACAAHYDYLCTLPVMGEALKQFKASGGSFPVQQIDHVTYFKYGYLLFITLNPVPESHDIFLRFAKVFEQTYTRFLDLQKAEAQTREAQIEAALEKVRSRSLAMHTTNELGEVVKVIVEKLQDLGVVLDANGVVLCTYFHDSKDVLHWIVSPDFSMAGSYLLPYFDHPIFNAAWDSKESGDEYFSKAFSVQEKNSFFEYAFEHSDYKYFPEDFKQWIFQNDKHILSFAWQKNSAILIPSHTGVVPNDAEKAILIRFSKVFEQAYVRFLDLQKAEAQTREAQIEASLERVRARTMAMHKSEELAETAAVLFRQMAELSVTPERLNICLIKEETNVLEVWSTDQEGVKINHHFNASLDEPTTGKRVYDAWKEKKKSIVIDLSGSELNDWIRYVREVMGMTIKEELVKEHRIHSVAFFSHGMILTTTPEPLPDESMNLLQRFADVFNLTYRRYLDLQKAEASAREATIEAALEKVRGKAMAMHNSNDLSVTASMVFTELRKLGITPIRCGVGLLNRESRKAQLYAATSSNEGDSLSLVGWVELSGHPVLEKIYDTWLKNEDYYPELSGEELTAYYTSLLKGLPVPVPDSQDIQKQYGTFLYFSVGGLFTWSKNPYNEAEIKILKRFATIID